MSTSQPSRLDPLCITRKICPKAHVFASNFELLDEVPLHVIVQDFLELGKPRRLWANEPWLQYTQQTLQQFQEYDFAANIAMPVKKIMHQVGQQVQVGRQVSNVKINMYPLDKPLPAIVMHQPVLIESFSNPLLLQTQWNNFSDVDDRSTLAAPLSFKFEGNICKRKHLFPESLELLDELPAYFVIYDFHEKSKLKQLWANSAWLHALDKTQQQFRRATLSAVTARRLLDDLVTIHQRVQVSREVMCLDCFLDCIDPPVACQAVLRPMLFERFDHPLVLCTLVPSEEPLAQDRRRGSREDMEAQDSTFAKQVTFLLDEGAIVFDFAQGPGLGEAVWCNFQGAKEYGLVYDCSTQRTPDGETMHLRTLLRSFDWHDDDDEGGGEGEAGMWRRLTQLPFDAEPLVVTARKRKEHGGWGEGGGVWHKLTFAPCKNPFSGENCLLVLESDVSSLMAAQAELQASNDLKDQFLQCMSHELRTPLSGIIGLSSAISVSPNCPPNVQNALKTIEKSALHLNELVMDILETAECMSAHFRLHYARVSLAAIADRVCDTFRPKLQPGVELRNGIVSSNDFTVQADERRVQKALMHLVDNAVKFTSSGSIELSARADDGDVTVSVTDTGCGIPEHLLERVWLQFEQGDMSSTRSHGGTGLGLALVKLIVKAHGGRASGSSEQRADGSTSTFSITLPLRQQATAFRALSVPDMSAHDVRAEAMGRDGGRGSRGLEAVRAASEGSGVQSGGEGWAVERVRELEAELRSKDERVMELERALGVRDDRAKRDRRANENEDQKCWACFATTKRSTEFEEALAQERKTVQALQAAQKQHEIEHRRMTSQVEADAATISELQRQITELHKRLRNALVHSSRVEQEIAPRLGEDTQGSGGATQETMSGDTEQSQAPTRDSPETCSEELAGDRQAPSETGRDDAGVGPGRCRWCARAQQQLERAMRMLHRMRGERVAGGIISEHAAALDSWDCVSTPSPSSLLSGSPLACARPAAFRGQSAAAMGSTGSGATSPLAVTRHWSLSPTSRGPPQQRSQAWRLASSFSSSVPDVHD